MIWKHNKETFVASNPDVYKGRRLGLHWQQTLGADELRTNSLLGRLTCYPLSHIAPSNSTNYEDDAFPSPQMLTAVVVTILLDSDMFIYSAYTWNTAWQHAVLHIHPSLPPSISIFYFLLPLFPNKYSSFFKDGHALLFFPKKICWTGLVRHVTC